MQIMACITYNMKKTHPDKPYVIGKWTSKRVFSHADIYTFDDELYKKSDIDSMKEYIKRDLALVAGGGYNTDHITNVKYNFKVI